MPTLQETVQDYTNSEHYLFLDSTQKEHAETLLSYWTEQTTNDPEPDDIENALKAVGQLDISLQARKSFPALLQTYFEYLESIAGFPKTSAWSMQIEHLEPKYLESFRNDGTMKGETIRKTLPKVGRNDPCPCGSGKKYKKCCDGLFS
ncbi:MAG: hypothetical protein ACI8V2_005441 [Candidatus Latescibacterota bacterium]|jgi:uncharacterized protein YecA (UPF0149 family)